jgi:hypothetical protein
LEEKKTTFNRYQNGNARNLTVKELKAKNLKLIRQYAPVRTLTPEEYEQEKRK